LAELGAASAIHPHLAADDEAVRLFDRGRTLARTLEIDVPDWRLGLRVLAPCARRTGRSPSSTGAERSPARSRSTFLTGASAWPSSPGACRLPRYPTGST